MASRAPKRLEEYRDVAYWDARYGASGAADGATYEWLLPYERVREYLGARPGADVLVVGCGNSTLGEELADRDGARVTAVDYSAAVVAQMQARAPHRPGLRYALMDMRRLELPDASFDLVVDKASIDALYTDGGSVWSPSERVRSDVGATLAEVRRVLRPGGCLVSVSFGQPHFRLPLLRAAFPDAAGAEIPDTFYHVYTATKAP